MDEPEDEAQEEWPDAAFWQGVYRRADVILNLPLAEVMKDEYRLDPETPEEH